MSNQLILTVAVGAFIVFAYYMLNRFYFIDQPVPKTAKDQYYAKAIARYVQLCGLIDQIKTTSGVEYMAQQVVDFENYYTMQIDPKVVQQMVNKLYDRLHARQTKILSTVSS